jgi:transposase
MTAAPPGLVAAAWDPAADCPAWDRVVGAPWAASWKVERALSWLSCFRRLQVRWDRDSGRFFAFVLLACALVCFNRL